MLTRNAWMLCCGALLATASAAAPQDVCRPAAPQVPRPAPYYNEMADVIYPPRQVSEPVQWIRLFNAMAERNQPEARCAPTAGPRVDDLQVSYPRSSQPKPVSSRKMRELYWLTEPEAKAAALDDDLVTAPPGSLPVFGAAIGTGLGALSGSVVINERNLDLSEQRPADARHHVAVRGLKAQADRLTLVPGTDLLLLEGNVILDLTRKNHPARILTERATISLKNGTYEIMPPNLEKPVQGTGPIECEDEGTIRTINPIPLAFPPSPGERGWR
jgi:hypothetical protein